MGSCLAILRMFLGIKLLVAGLEKDPEDAGRIIAAAITQAGAPAAAKPDAKAAPKTEIKAETQPKETPQAAK